MLLLLLLLLEVGDIAEVGSQRCLVIGSRGRYGGRERAIIRVETRNWVGLFSHDATSFGVCLLSIDCSIPDSYVSIAQIGRAHV